MLPNIHLRWVELPAVLPFSELRCGTDILQASFALFAEPIVSAVGILQLQGLATRQLLRPSRPSSRSCHLLFKFGRHWFACTHISFNSAELAPRPSWSVASSFRFFIASLPTIRVRWRAMLTNHAAFLPGDGSLAQGTPGTRIFSSQQQKTRLNWEPTALVQWPTSVRKGLVKLSAGVLR